MRSIEPGISRFRVRSFGPSRNDDVDELRTARNNSRRNNLLALLAESVDAERDDIADFQELLRFHAEANAGRRARGDDVAGQQRQERRHIGDALRQGEDHGRGVAGLAALAVDVEPQAELLHIRDFILGDQPGAEWTEGVVRLTLGPLAAAFLLEVTLGDVVADAVA